jgi:uncharacterized membrane protein YgdD (TMEM256/DUF423 family)
MTTDRFIKIAIYFAVTAVALGSLGAHALKDILSNNQLHSLETGVRYQLFHAITLLILSLNTEKFNHNLRKILNLMTTGVCLFSFSIYLYKRTRCNRHFLVFFRANYTYRRPFTNLCLAHITF